MRLDFDHAQILHDDLDSAAAAAVRLGFRPTPPGLHGQGLGTANVTVVMPDRATYFEVLAVTAPTERNAAKRAALAARGAHLFGAAFKADARAAAVRLARLDMAEGPAFEFAREVDLPDGAAEARFAVAQLRDGTLPGLYAFVCQHFTPGRVWHPDCLDHPNGARAVAGLWGVTPDAAATASACARLFGNATQRSAEGVVIDSGAVRLRYLTPEAWAARFGEVVTAPPPTPQLRALEIAVTSAARLEDRLAGAGVTWQAAGRRRLVTEVQGFGTMLLFAVPRSDREPPLPAVPGNVMPRRRARPGRPTGSNAR